MHWIKAVEQWKIEGMGNNGCTFPFLVGIEFLVSGKIPKPSAISEIIRYASFNKDNKLFWLRNCGDIRHPVLQITTKQGADSTNSTWFKNLLVENDFLWKGKNIESVIDTLIDENSSKINNQEYSYNGNRFGEYTPKDIRFIQKITS